MGSSGTLGDLIWGRGSTPESPPSTRTHILSGPEHAGNKLAKFHFCFKNSLFSSLFACFEDPASGGSQALQWSDIYVGGRVWTTGRSVGPQGHQTLSLACPGTIPHRFPGPGADPGLLSGTGASVLSRIVFCLSACTVSGST